MAARTEEQVQKAMQEILRRQLLRVTHPVRFTAEERARQRHAEMFGPIKDLAEGEEG